jgi:hypothetical protein
VEKLFVPNTVEVMGELRNCLCLTQWSDGEAEKLFVPNTVSVMGVWRKLHNKEGKEHNTTEENRIAEMSTERKRREESRIE